MFSLNALVLMGESLAVTHALMLNPHISTHGVVVNRIRYVYMPFLCSSY